MSLMGRVYYYFGSCPVDMEEMPSIGFFDAAHRKMMMDEHEPLLTFSIPFFFCFLKKRRYGHVGYSFCVIKLSLYKNQKNRGEGER